MLTSWWRNWSACFGRELVARLELELYMAEKAWDEACYELGKRIAKMVQKGIFSVDATQLMSKTLTTVVNVKFCSELRKFGLEN